MSSNGLVTVESRFSVRETVDRMIAAITSAGLLVFARIDHGANAAQVGMELRPTELLIFGNPKGGTPLMQDKQTSGIDLPIKALAWEDEEGKVWLTYNEASWLAARHELGTRSKDAINAIEKGQVSLVRSILKNGV